MLIHRQNCYSSENLDRKPEIGWLGQTIHRPRQAGMRNILLVSASPGEWGIPNRTLIKATQLSHESVGGGAPPLFPPLPLPLPRLPCPRPEVGGLASVDAKAPDTASVGGACCDARGGACFASRWRTVGVDKTSGCTAAAGPPRARAPSSLLLPPPSLFGPGAPSFADSPSFSFSFSFSFSAARSRLLPPFVTPAPLRAASNCLDASPSTGRDRLPEPSELAGAREGAGAGVIGTPESARVLEDEGAFDAA